MSLFICKYCLQKCILLYISSSLYFSPVLTLHIQWYERCNLIIANHCFSVSVVDIIITNSKHEWTAMGLIVRGNGGNLPLLVCYYPQEDAILWWWYELTWLKGNGYTSAQHHNLLLFNILHTLITRFDQVQTGAFTWNLGRKNQF